MESRLEREGDIALGCCSDWQRNLAAVRLQIYLWEYALPENRICRADTAPIHSRHLQIPEATAPPYMHRSVRQDPQGAFLQENILHSCCPDQKLFRASFRLAGNPALFHFLKDTVCRDGIAHTRIPVHRTAEAIALLQPDHREGCPCRGILLPCDIETADDRDRSTIF